MLIHLNVPLSNVSYGYMSVDCLIVLGDLRLVEYRLDYVFDVKLYDFIGFCKGLILVGQEIS